MNDKLDKVLEKLGAMLDTWLDEFQANPVRTTVKVLLVLIVVKYARRALR